MKRTSNIKVTSYTRFIAAGAKRELLREEVGAMEKNVRKSNLQIVQKRGLAAFYVPKKEGWESKTLGSGGPLIGDRGSQHRHLEAYLQSC